MKVIKIKGKMQVKQFTLIWKDDEGEFEEYVSFYENEEGFKYSIEECAQKRQSIYEDSAIVLKKCGVKIETLEN
jgi:hypothetical protein